MVIVMMVVSVVMVIFGDHDDQDGHGRLRPWFNAMSVLTNMIVVSMVDGNGDLGGHNYFGGQNDHHIMVLVVEVFNHVIMFFQGTKSWSRWLRFSTM